MSVTQCFIQQFQQINALFTAILEKDRQIDADYEKNVQDIASGYQAKITTLDVERQKNNAGVEKDYQNKLTALEYERNKSIGAATLLEQKHRKALESDLTQLTHVEASIPAKLCGTYQQAVSYRPAAPDFQELESLSKKINDTTLLGWFKRLFSIAGYAPRRSMVQTFFDASRAAQAFLKEEIQRGAAELAHVRNSAEQTYQAEKADIDRKKTAYQQQLQQNDQAAKTEASRKKAAYQQQNDEQKKARTRALEQELNATLENQALPQFDRAVLSAIDSLGAFEEAWDDYTPAQAYPAELMIGAIDIPSALPDPLNALLKEKMPVTYSSGASVMLPFTEEMSGPTQLLIEYDTAQKDTLMSGIQSIIMKLLKFMPPFSFSLSYIDPNDRGSNLGQLQKLSGITSSDLCRKVYASREDIQKRLKELELFVDKTCALLSGIDSVYTYNATSAFPIPYHFMVINDYPEKFERNAMESLEVLINNARKCGISMIFTSSAGIAQFPDSVRQFRRVTVSANGVFIALGGQKYHFTFDSVCANCENFIEKVKFVYNEGIKIDNSFTVYFDVSQAPRYQDSTQVMMIPFAVDSRKQLIALELGSPLTAHALLSGTTGSGKSTTLHMLITSIVMNYSPDDVELWLVDYKKVEFAEYIANTPPHICLIGLERGEEFTYSLLDMIDAEFQRRLELFKSAGVNTITEYKQKHGVGSIPRVILIIDEFHHLTQAIQNEPQYVRILENLLSEYRVFGLSCIFSDQAISDGLRGLTEKGRKQIRTRIAMSNDMSEVRETLALDSSFYDDALKSKINKMNTGDVIFKRAIEDDIGEIQVMVDKYKTILAQREDRIAVIQQTKKYVGANFIAKKVIIVDGQDRKRFDKQIIADYENENGVAINSAGRQIPVYIGTPANLNPCFCFYLKEQIDSNIMVIGANEDLRASVILHTLYSFKRQQRYKIYIFADKDDELYTRYREQFNAVVDKDTGIRTDISDICVVLNELSQRLKPAAHDTHTLIVWLGFEMLGAEFSLFPEKQQLARPETKTVASVKPNHTIDAGLQEAEKYLAMLGALAENPAEKAPLPENDVSADSAEALNDIEAMLEAELNAFVSPPPAQALLEPQPEVYNAQADIQEIIAKGSRYGLYTLLTYSSVKLLRQTKFVKVDNFEHRIAFTMSLDDSSTYLGRGSFASGLDNISAAYYDGGSSIRIFRPYLITGA
jgi:rRNA-processing protein FCF1